MSTPKHTPTPSLPATYLLITSLYGGAAVNTDCGSDKLWKELERLGFVSKGPKSPFGHKFNFAITQKGESLIRETICVRPTRESERFTGDDLFIAWIKGDAAGTMAKTEYRAVMKAASPLNRTKS